MNDPESTPKKLVTLHIGLEGYQSTADPEFLDNLQRKLLVSGLKADDLFFSGFDGSPEMSGQDIPRHPYIFGMNLAGWKDAIKMGEHNPAQYAEGYKVPCIGLYDKTLLREVYSSTIDQASELADRIKLGDIEVGDGLGDIATDKPISEAVVYTDYPKGSPTDALVGLVFIG